MAFASLFVPNFAIQAVARKEPLLRSRSLALVDGNPPLCKVVAVNEFAAKAGVQCGMNKASATQFVEVEIRSRSRAQEASAHAALLDIAWSVSPRIEDTSEDTVVLDVHGLGHLFSSEEEIGKRLLRCAAACGLFPNVAIASNFETAVIAARGFSGVTLVPPGQESEILSSLPIDVLRPSEEIAETLHCWGIRTCGSLAKLPILQLSERLGQAGILLHGLARGAGLHSLVVADEGSSFREEMELDDAVEELDSLSFLLGRMLEALCERLAAHSLSAAAIVVEFELRPSFENAIDSHNEVVRQKPRPAKFQTRLELPIPMRDPKLLLKLLRLRLQANSPGAPIQQIALSAESARSRSIQAGLFVPRFPEPEKLGLIIARIANVVGEQNVGSPSLTDTHHPEGFRMNRGLTPVDEKEMRKSAACTGQQSTLDRIVFGFRVFRPPVPACVEFHSGRPARVAFQNMQGNVLAASGPWPTSGNWWREDFWSHEEWDLEMDVRPLSNQYDSSGNSAGLPHRGLYRFYYDALRQSWFVRGSYD